MSSAGKFLKQIVWIVLVGVSGYLLAKGMMKLREKPSAYVQGLMRYAYGNVEEAAAKYYMPAGFYEKEQSGDWNQRIWENIWSSVPLLTYLEQETMDETLIEDEETCDLIIEESQNMIKNEMMLENMEQLQNNEQQEEEQQNAEGSEQEDVCVEQEIQTSLPAWAIVSDAEEGVLLSDAQLQDFDFIKNQFFVVDPNTTTDAQEIQGKIFMEKDFHLEKTQEPQILIYHTHSQEMYADSVEGDENTSVIGVGNYLEQLLEEVFGYQVLHLKNTFDLVDGTLDRSNAYTYALPVIEETLEENPSIEIVIDLHRDGVAEDKHLVTEVNGKPTAQIMFFNGLSKTVKNGTLESLPNPYIQENLAFAFQLSYYSREYYPDFTRCIYLKGYRYNLHVRPRSILLEVGAQTNTVEEAMNAMEPFSVLLDKVLQS